MGRMTAQETRLDVEGRVSALVEASLATRDAALALEEMRPEMEALVQARLETDAAEAVLDAAEARFEAAAAREVAARSALRAAVDAALGTGR